MMGNVKILLAALAAALPIGGAAAQDAACAAPPASLIAPAPALIDRSARIVIAEIAPYAAEPAAPAANGEAAEPSGAPLDRDAAINRATQDGEAAKGDNGAGQGRQAGQLPGGEPERITLSRKLTRLRVLEDIKGAGPEFIYLARAPEAPIGDAFDHHRGAAFWRDALVGRARIDAQCRIAVAFAPETRYLVFVGPPHVKSYEAIEEPDDAWLAYVRARLAAEEDS